MTMAISHKCLRLALANQAGRDSGKTVLMTVSPEGVPLRKPQRVQAGVSLRQTHALSEGHHKNRFML